MFSTFFFLGFKLANDKKIYIFLDRVGEKNYQLESSPLDQLVVAFNWTCPVMLEDLSLPIWVSLDLKTLLG